ncbi:MAG TPA: YdeI/OmpD-associated family protein [Methanomassiliicoccales archaeon]|jgi:hypothetical protein
MVIFRTRLIGPGAKGEGPSIVTNAAQSRSLGDLEEVQVKGTINGVSFEGLFISNGDGTHYLNPDRGTLLEAHLNVGDEFVIWVEPLPSPPLELPDDLKEALMHDRSANETFESLPPRRKREHVEYIEDAKMSNTRTARVRRTIERLKEGSS